MLHIYGNFGGENGDGNIDEQGDGREAGKQADEQQEAADDFNAADKGSEELRMRDADASKTARTPLRDEEKFFDALEKKYPPGQPANDPGGGGSIGLHELLPHEDFLHESGLSRAIITAPR